MINFQIADCSQHTFCPGCLGALDPFCGWCSLQNECRLGSECGGAAAAGWISGAAGRRRGGGGGQCVHLEDIRPAVLPAEGGGGGNVTLVISSLPDLPANDR